MENGKNRRSLNILWKLLGAALVSLIIARIVNRPVTSYRGPLTVLTPPFTANKIELIRELRDRKFQDLDKKLNSYQKAFEENVLQEGNLSIAFESFSFPDPALSPMLDEWVKSELDSFPAHLARAKHLFGLEWQARARSRANTDAATEQQLNEMQHLFVEGVKEAVAAIKLNSKSSIAYAAIIDAARGASDGTTMKRVYTAGIERIPLSLSIRASVMLALEPRWGGTREEMDKFAAEAQKYAAQNPRLVSLRGFADEDRGDVAIYQGDPKRAVQFLNRALEVGGDFARGYECRGRAYENLDRFDDALEDLNRANRLRPQDPDTLESMAIVLSHLSRPKQALAVIQEYRQFAEPDSDLVNVERWAQNFGIGIVPVVKTGGN